MLDANHTNNWHGFHAVDFNIRPEGFMIIGFPDFSTHVEIRMYTAPQEWCGLLTEGFCKLWTKPNIIKPNQNAGLKIGSRIANCNDGRKPDSTPETQEAEKLDLNLSLQPPEPLQVKTDRGQILYKIPR